MPNNTTKESTKCEEKQLCKGDGLDENSSKCLESKITRDEELRKLVASSGSGDLYVFGRLWVEALRTGLLGTKWSLVPTVHAAPPPPNIPKKPPCMKYKDLPIYDAPHYEYKEYKAEGSKCPALKRKFIHESLQPYVSSLRQSATQTGKEVCCELRNFKKYVTYEFCKKKQNFIHYMRCPNNMALRQATVAMGGITGYLLTRKRGGVCIKLAGISAGLLCTGAVCFPEETDEYFREVSYHAGKSFLTFYNFVCNKMAGMRKRLPCPREMPGPVAARPPTECTKKREAEKAEKEKKEAAAKAAKAAPKK